MIPAFPEMTLDAIVSVDAFGNLIINKPHNFVDVRLWSYEFQMIVVVHHFEVLDSYVVSLSSFSKDLDDYFVSPFFENKSSAVCPGRDMIGIFVLADAIGSRHARSYSNAYTKTEFYKYQRVRNL